jgi:hypothetical protein
MLVNHVDPLVIHNKEYHPTPASFHPSALYYNFQHTYNASWNSVERICKTLHDEKAQEMTGESTPKLAGN